MLCLVENDVFCCDRQVTVMLQMEKRQQSSEKAIITKTWMCGIWQQQLILFIASLF